VVRSVREFEQHFLTILQSSILHAQTVITLICAKFVAKLLPDDKEKKGKQPLDTHLQFKG